MTNRLSQRQRAFEVLLADLSSRFANIPCTGCPGRQQNRNCAETTSTAFLGFDRSTLAKIDADGPLNVLCSVAVR